MRVLSFRKKSGPQHQASDKCLECGIHGALKMQIGFRNSAIKVHALNADFYPASDKDNDYASARSVP